jgi:multidrug efflux pump subunit AcrA (membrane-fusion protein)
MNRTRPATRGLSTLAVVLIVVVVGAVGAGAWWLISQSIESASGGRAELVAARRGGFDIVVPASGELAAIREMEIRNELEERAAITEIVAEGAHVKKGEVILRFNADDLATRIKDAEDELNNAENTLENAQADLEIKNKTRESELAAADLKITLTDLALKSWEEGEVVETRQNLNLELKTAQMEHARLKDRFEASRRLYEQEFISLDEFKQDEIALIRSETNLKQAELAIDIYEKYEFEQQREQMESDKRQAVEERDRIQQRLDAEVRSAESDVRSAERQVESRRERLDKWQRQHKLCVVVAPSDGLVVYTSSMSTGMHGRGGDEQPPMVGTDVPPKKTIMIIPDISEMIAEVKVNEALSGQIVVGQKATIVSDALPDKTLRGEVISIGVLATTSGFRDPNRRDYTIKIRLLDYSRDMGLKPSMRCRSDISIGRVSDALYVPIQAVHRRGEAAFVWTPDGGGFSQRAVDIGRASELYVEITRGMDEGEMVLLEEPAPDRIVRTLTFPAPGDPAAAGAKAGAGPDAARGV